MDLFGNWLAEKFPGDVITVGDFSKTHLAAFFEYLTGTRENQPQTAALRIRHIEAAWRWLYEDEEWGDEIPRPRSIQLPRVPPRRTLAPTWAECDACIGAARFERHRRVLLLLRYTGLRVGQALAMEWEDLDLAARRLHVRPELGKTLHEKSGRFIPISRSLRNELLTWPRTTDLVVPGTGLRRTHQLTQEAWEASQVEDVKWRNRPHHAFRRAFQSELKRAGADTEAVQYLVGHALGATRDEYVDPDALPLVAAVELVTEVGATSGTVVEMKTPATRWG